jgi:type III pantothenate kinase
MFPDEPIVICDFGTAITVDAVSAKGEYLGGSIATGIDTSATALFASTAQINRVELVAPPSAIGKNTTASVQSGIIYGTAALVDGLVERVVKELGGHARVIATGGFAHAMAEHCHRLEQVEPRLTLLGLRLIFERNADDV